MKINALHIRAMLAKGMKIAISYFTPILKFDAKFECRICSPHKFIFGYA